MEFCKYCKTPNEKTGQCRYCGNVMFKFFGTMYYGATKKQGSACEFVFTNKYLLVNPFTKGEMVGNVTAGMFGILGCFIANGINNSKTQHYAFYDLQKVNTIVFPYNAKGLKKGTAFKFFMNDGTDFIISFNKNGLFSAKYAHQFSKLLAQARFPLVSGAGNAFPALCMNPMVTKETYCRYVAPSAIPFLAYNKHPYVAQIPTTPPVQQPGMGMVQESPNECTQMWKNRW